MSNTENKWGSLHISFFTALIAALNEDGIRYFILRNYEELPLKNTGKDLDIVIEPGKYQHVKELILKTIKEHNIGYYTITQFDRMRCWYIMDIDKNFGIHIDIIENEIYKGFEFFRFDEMYDHTIKRNDFVVLDKVYDTVLLLVQNLVAYKSLKPKYCDTVSQNYNDNRLEIYKVLSDFWGNEYATFLDENITSQNFKKIVDFAPKLERKALLRIFMKRPLTTIKNIGRFLFGKVYRIIWCPKKYWRFIAVIAPDGAGKTTFIDTLVKKLQHYYVSDEGRFQIHHFRPTILPNLGAAGEKAGLMKEDKDFTNPHRAKPAGFVSSLIRMTYYWLDYVIGTPLLLRKEVQYEKYTIFDRYIYDFLVDPHRSRINLPYWLRKQFARLVIQPQIVFVLTTDVETIYARKQELTKDEIGRQLAEFKKLGSNSNRFVFLDASKSAEEVADSAIAILMAKFMNKPL